MNKCLFIHIINSIPPYNDDKLDKRFKINLFIIGEVNKHFAVSIEYLSL